MFAKIFIAALMIGSTLSEINIGEHVDKINTIVETMCQKAGVKDDATVTKVKDSGKEFVECIKKFIDPKTLENEIEEAKPRGALDEVFKKYCDKSSELKQCIRTLVDTATPCFDEGMKDHSAGATNATNQLIDFVCFKDGDRIALFIAEEGPQCFQSKVKEISECATKMRDSIPSYEEAKKLSNDERCAKFDELSNCIVRSLEGCDAPTPANMAESLLRFIRKGSPCNKK